MIETYYDPDTYFISKFKIIFTDEFKNLNYLDLDNPVTIGYKEKMYKVRMSDVSVVSVDHVNSRNFHAYQLVVYRYAVIIEDYFTGCPIDGACIDTRESCLSSEVLHDLRESAKSAIIKHNFSTLNFYG